MIDERVVWGEGPFSAKLVIVGQNPGPDEMETGRPFTGGSGRVLDYNLGKVGISRSRCYVTNVVKHFVPPGQPVPPELIKWDRPMLDKELGMLKDAEVILTLGQEAFSALTGREMAIRHNRKGAEKNPRAWLRGCPFKLDRPGGMGHYWVIPAVHPSFIMRTGFAEAPLFRVDLERARRFAEGFQPCTEHFIGDPTDKEVREYVADCIAAGECGLDIETPETAVEDDELDPLYQTPIELIGLSARVGESIGIRPDQLDLAKPLLDGVSGRPPVVCWTHNGSGFDFYHLGKRFTLAGVKRADCMLGMHLLWSHITTKDAATCFSIFTDIPYYKNTRKLDPDFYNTIGNCRDTYGALWAGRSILREMQNFPGMEDLFWRSMMGITDLLNEWRVVGINTDTDKAGRLLLRLAMTLQKYEEWWGKTLPTVSWSSPKQLIELFRGMGLPIFKRKRQSGIFSESCDDEALEAYSVKYGNKTAGLIRVMRELRHAGDFLNVASSDGRVHSRFKAHGQVGGRIQAVDPDLQNIPEEIAGVYPRAIFIPDKPREQVFGITDFSQIEYRLYVTQANDPKGIEEINSGDYIYGIFYEDIFEEPFFETGGRSKAFIRPDVPPWKLLVAKSWPLGFIYGRGVPDTTGLPITSGKSRSIYDGFHRTHPRIRPFHTELEFRATRDGYLLSPFGRMRQFPNPKGQRNEILAFPGQTVAVDVLISRALLPLPRELKERFGGRLLFSVHDSVGWCCLKEKAREAKEFVDSTMSAPIPELGGLSIPVETKLGPSWGEAKRWEKYLAELTNTPPAVGEVPTNAAREGLGA